MLVHKELSLLVSSNPQLGAINVNKDGSSFEINFDDPLQIPPDALNVTVALHESTIWYTTPNIIKDENDTMYIFGDTESGGSQLFQIKIPQGLYDVSGLNIAVLSELEKQGARTLDNNGEYLPLVNLTGDSNTQKVIIRFNYNNVTVDFRPENTPRVILGFNQELYGPFILSPINQLAENIAAFNQLNSFLIATNLVSRGIRINNRYNQVIARVPINVQPGSQIVFSPFNPAKSEAQGLAGSKRTVLRFRLTDQNFRSVNTNSEYWNCRVVISFDQPLILNRN